MDWDSLTRNIIDAARASFSDLMNQHREESFYAFILYTDNDCYTVLPSANSIEKHNEKILNENVKDAKSIAAYKWYIGEWFYEAWKDSEFDKICKELSDASQVAYTSGSFLKFKEHVHACMIKALLLLDKEGFWGRTRGNIVLFISSSEYDESKDMENSSAKILNPQKIYERFLKRYNV